MDKNKRGISAVIATVLIILITVASVTVVWVAVIPMISDKLDSSTVCLDAVSQIQLLDEGYTCWDSVAKTVSIQVKHGSSPLDLVDIQVLVSSGGDTTMFKVSNDTTTLIPVGANVPLPGANEEKVYVIDTSSVTGTISSVQIAPVVAVGTDEEICDVSDVRTLQAC